LKHLLLVLYFFAALATVVLVLRLFMPFRQIWEGWKKIAHKLGVIQTNILLTVVYFLILPIFALIAGRKRLRLKLDPTSASYWEDVKPLSNSIEDAGRPF
jgi:hypothetical protein